MTEGLSTTQVDRLGNRLRRGLLVESDLRSLDDYRRSFGEAYETVVHTIREQLHLEPTGRPAKSTHSLIEKLHRESIRLAQVQDIAGCRVVVADAAEQERAVASLRTVFPEASVDDRRANPSYGYRAVHVIAKIFGVLVEIQVRTSLQHLWAEFSEKLSDVVDPSIKYGAGRTKSAEC
jgi:putative GTP pyrophosphokinase